MNTARVYIANSGDDDYGITVAELDYAAGRLHIIQQVTEISECHYLTLHPNRQYLYGTTMDGEVEAVAFAVDQASGQLSRLNSQPAAGTSPCYILVEASQKNVLMVNYTVAGQRGNIRVYPIGADGHLQGHSEIIEHDGRSVNPDRQAESHPHMILTTPDNHFALVPDLGTDKIYIYALDTARGKLRRHTTLDLPAGAGPRHLAFHPDLPVMYVINELDSTMMAWAYDDQYNWIHRKTVSTLPADAALHNQCADVHVHPNGKFLYGSNRGHDSIVIYALDEAGMPSLIGHESTRGHWPRAFVIDPRGEYLIVGNRHSDNAAVFAIDPATGALHHRSTLDLDAPIAFKMFG